MLADARHDYPKLSALVREAATDCVQSAINTEREPLASLWRLALMTMDEFGIYVAHVGMKTATRLGSNEVISFETPYSKGPIRIGMNPEDRSFANVWFSSLDRDLNVGCNITVLKGAEFDVGPIAESLARSFAFAIDALPNSEEVARLIGEAGIRKSKNNQRGSEDDD